MELALGMIQVIPWLFPIPVAKVHHNFTFYFLKYVMNSSKNSQRSVIGHGESADTGDFVNWPLHGGW